MPLSNRNKGSCRHRKLRLHPGRSQWQLRVHTLLVFVFQQTTAHMLAHHIGMLADQAESDYEDEDMVAPLQVTSQDNDQYHGRGWRAKKARGCSSNASTLPTDDAEAHAAAVAQQAIWGGTAEPGVKEQATTSEQSASTAYAEDTVTSRSTTSKVMIWHEHVDFQKATTPMSYHEQTAQMPTCRSWQIIVLWPCRT